MLETRPGKDGSKINVGNPHQPKIPFAVIIKAINNKTFKNLCKYNPGICYIPKFLHYFIIPDILLQFAATSLSP